jgi:septum site-determining protein MinC
MLGIGTQVQSPKRAAAPVKQAEEIQPVKGESAIFVQKTLRSGAKIQNSGSVVVLGDVNPGAEIIAGGNVIIWGRMRGTAQAGSEGNEQAVVCALEMNPMNLRIAGSTLDWKSAKSKPGPAVASLVSGVVTIQPWKHPTI